MDVTDATPDLAPACSDEVVGHTVWFEVTPEVSGPLTVSTCHPATTYDTVLQAWRPGEEFPTPIDGACVDDTPGPECINACDAANPLGSRLTLDARAGTSYLFQIGSYEANESGCDLCLGAIFTVGEPCGDAPTNLFCSQARELSGAPGTHEAVVDVRDAFVLPSEPRPACTGDEIGHSVWFSVVPEVSGTLTFTTCHPNTSYDTVLQAYRGDCTGMLAAVDCKDDTDGPACNNRCGESLGSAVSFEALAGVRYYFQVGSFGNNEDDCDLCLGVLLTIGEVAPPQFFFAYSVDVPPSIEDDPGSQVVFDAKVTLTVEGNPSDFGAQSWSVAIAVEGEAVLIGATTEDTSGAPRAAGGFREDGFERTEIVDPGLNGGQQGAVSTVALSLTELVSLPPNGTEPILKLVLEAPVLAEACENPVHFHFVDALRGSAGPVANLVSFAGPLDMAGAGGAAGNTPRLLSQVSRVRRISLDPSIVGPIVMTHRVRVGGINPGNLNQCGPPPPGVGSSNEDVDCNGSNESWASTAVLNDLQGVTMRVLCVSGSFFALKLWTTPSVVRFAGGCQYLSASNSASMVYEDIDDDGFFTNGTDRLLETNWTNLNTGNLTEQNTFHYVAQNDDLTRVKWSRSNSSAPWVPGSTSQGFAPAGCITTSDLYDSLFFDPFFLPILPEREPGDLMLMAPADPSFVVTPPKTENEQSLQAFQGGSVAFRGQVVGRGCFEEPVRLQAALFQAGDEPVILGAPGGPDHWIVEPPFPRNYQAVVEVPEDLPVGEYRVLVWAQTLPGSPGGQSLTGSAIPAPSASIQILPSDGGLQIPGDCNQDARLDVSDGVCLFGFLFQGSPAQLPCGDGSAAAPGNRRLADFNGDGGVDLADGVGVLLFLFQDGPPHVLGRECIPIPACPPTCGR